MTPASQSKSLAIIFLLGAFISGGVIGFAADRAMSSSTSNTVTRAYTVKQGRDELAKELGLNASQRLMLDTILDWRNNRDNELLKPMRPVRDSNRDSARTLILQRLDPTQQQKFMQIIERMRARSDSNNQKNSR